MSSGEGGGNREWHKGDEGQEEGENGKGEKIWEVGEKVNSLPMQKGRGRQGGWEGVKEKGWKEDNPTVNPFITSQCEC